MRKIKLVLAVSLALAAGVTSATAFASSATANDGSCVVLGVRQPGTNIYDGPTWCGKVNLSYITVRGPLVLNNTMITGETDVSGPVDATDASLKDVVLESQATAVDVTLQDSTNVNGNITFNGSIPGVVYLESGSKISGKVINGKIVNN